MKLFFFTWGGCTSCLHACLGARFLPQSYQYPNLSEGADCVGGQLCLCSGVTKSGRIWRKVPESDAWSEWKTFSIPFKLIGDTPHLLDFTLVGGAFSLPATCSLSLYEWPALAEEFTSCGCFNLTCTPANRNTVRVSFAALAN